MSKDDKSVYLLIESGKPLELIKHYISECQRVNSENIALLKLLGTKRARLNSFTGVILAVAFDGAIHTDFCKPDKYGACKPKKKTEWYERFKSQKGYEFVSDLIERELGIPLIINYSKVDGSEGGQVIGGIKPCGFLWITNDGPYCLYIPDIEAEVKEKTQAGYTVAEPTNSFKPNIEGCRRIYKEDWELLITQDAAMRVNQASTN